MTESQRVITQRTQASVFDWDLYGGSLLASLGIGIAVFIGCERWHSTWAALSLSEIALKGPEPLAAQYPWVSAIVVALIVLFVCRVLIFFHRLESRR